MKWILRRIKYPVEITEIYLVYPLTVHFLEGPVGNHIYPGFGNRLEEFLWRYMGIPAVYDDGLLVTHLVDDIQRTVDILQRTIFCEIEGAVHGQFAVSF